MRKHFLGIATSRCLGVAVAVGLSTCTPVADSGADAEPDVLADVSTDNWLPPVDVAQPDVPVDGGPDDPGWVPLPGMPQGARSSGRSTQSVS